MVDLMRRFKASAGRHFVTLSCVQTLPDQSEKALVFSGFVVEIEGAWLYVTAGHVLRHFDAAACAGSTFNVWRLGDQTSAAGRFQDTAVPFEFEREEWLVIESEETGLDYAVIALHGYFRAQLEAGGVAPLDQSTWDYPVASEQKQWVLMGVPSESVAYDGVTILTARLVVVRIHAEEAPPEAGLRVDNQIYARLTDGSESIVMDADGLSGGPVFSVHKVDGEWKYTVVGIQSGWYRQSRLVAFCPWLTFARELEREIRMAQQELRLHDI